MAKDFVNPFDEGVTYEEFLKAIPKDKSVAEYCNKQLESDQLDWLLVELEHYKNNNQKQ